MPSPKIFITADLADLVQFRRYAERNRQKALDTATNRLASYYRRRFIFMANGIGSWKHLARRTLANKRYVQKKYGIGINPRWILRQSDTLFRSIAVIRESISSRAVGVVRSSRGPKPTYRGKRASQIAAYHQYGRGNNPKREIIVAPNRAVVEKMREDVRKQMNDFRRKNGR